ncbi:MAG: hypothetical protein NTW49_09465 [Bacteroidia bacterium]|nr:hypothetical protein [Bacteroidia bacterium]
MKIKTTLYVLVSAVVIALLCLVFYSLNYVESEGFCNADDGVVLAQSFRLFNGQLPHIDFISTKPVVSGLFHGLLFYLSYPLEISARWMTLMEYLLYSFTWTILLFNIFDIWFKFKKEIAKKTVNSLFYFCLAALGITFLNIGNYVLYPETTIDAILFSVAGIAFLMKARDKELAGGVTLSYYSLALFFMSLSALSRQSFIFLVAVIFCMAVIRLIKLHKYTAVFILLIAGLLPFWLYLFYLVRFHGLHQFITQMTGRTEFFDTAILRLAKSFLKSKLILFNLATIGFILWKTVIIKNGLRFTTSGFRKLISENKRIVSVILVTMIGLVLMYSYLLFLFADRMFMDRQWDMFWIMVNLSFFAMTGFELPVKIRYILILNILLSWCSSISLGSNSPVFTTGLMAGTSVLLAAWLLCRFDFKLPGIRVYYHTSIAIIVLSLVLVSFYGQRKINYYDRPSSELKCNLGTLVPGFGNIMTNPVTYDYYAEFMSIYRQLPGAKDHFVLLPNNAVIYPLLYSRNPFPLDWMQHDEYIGSEELVYKKISQALDAGYIWVIVDKYDSQNMAFGLIPLDYSGVQADDLFIKKYKVDKYGYMKILMSRCVELPMKFKYFRVYRTKTKIE